PVENAGLVEQAFLSIHQPLDQITIFHTDRGSEFKNECIDKLVKAFGIQRSLSKKGCPYDNAVAEATYNIFKTEFVFDSQFKTLQELSLALDEYVLWYNNVRIHSALGYTSPVAYRLLGNSPVR
ncbi:MAG: IS3 family transposase, partial [Ruthenibacterium sp.]